MCVIGAVCYSERAGIPAETCCREYCEYNTSKNIKVHFVGSVNIFGSDQCPEGTCLRDTLCSERTFLIPYRSDEGHDKWPDRVDYRI